MGKMTKKAAKKKTVKKVSAKKTVKKNVVAKKAAAKKIIKKKTLKKAANKKIVKKNVVAKKAAAKKIIKKKTLKKAANKKIVKKTAKNKLNQKDLLKLKKILLEKKVSIMNKLNSRKLAETDTEIGDEADTATQNNEREIQFELDEISAIAIKDIDNALAKFNVGTFGLCECCGSPISVKRLHAMPWGRYCIECQTEAEKNASKQQ